MKTHKPESRKRRKGRKTAKPVTALSDSERRRKQVKGLREQLQALVQDHETALQEYESVNEELQTTNEELEAAPKVLQSANEKLTTTNEELASRNAELTQANDDLVNFVANVNIPAVIVGSDLRIRRFTPQAQKLLDLLPGDIGRPISEIRLKVNIENVEQFARDAIDNLAARECEVRHVQNGGWYLLRARPYKTFDNRIDGAMISLQDIDALKRHLDQTRTYADALVENARQPTLVLDGDLRVTVANRVFYETFEASPQDTEGRKVYELGSGQWNIPTLRDLLAAITTADTRIDDFEVNYDFPVIGTRTMLLNARRVEPEPGQRMILLAIEDVTEKARHLEALRRQAALLDLVPDAVLTYSLEGAIQYWNRGAEELYGWRKEEAIGCYVHQLLHTEFPKPVNEVRQELVRTGYWEGELVHTRRDGSKRVVSSRWALQKGTEETSLVLAINSDITKRKKAEDTLRGISGRLMRVQDEERRRIARELHDSVGQKLAIARINLDNLRGQLPPESKVNSTIAECGRWIEESAQEIRTVVQLLHPPLLDVAGLGSAIRSLVEGFSKRASVAVDLVLPRKLRQMPADVELTLFRIVQEALNNVLRHSGAQSVKIELIQEPGATILTVSDDGKGLPAKLLKALPGTSQPLGVGILGMSERLAQFGGNLEIRNGQKGAVISARVPLPAQAAAASDSLEA